MQCKNCGNILAQNENFCCKCGFPAFAAKQTVPTQMTRSMQTKTESFMLEYIVAGFLCFCLTGGLLLYIFLGGGSNTGGSNHRKKAEITKEPPYIAFENDKYALAVKCAEDMSKYLECKNIDKEQVEWSADSEHVQVGSNGIVAIQDYNVTSNLTAKSKEDASVIASCQVSTLSEKEDFQNKVISYNSDETKNRKTEDGMVVVQNDNSTESKISVYEDKQKTSVVKDQYKWDRKLFYRLEAVEGQSGGGEINDYQIARKQFINADSGNVMEYEVYKQPQKGTINKVVAIEHMDANLEVTEYYYTNKGKVNFIFQYLTENYLPTYANPSIEGSRYYFDKDAMVNWRVVKEDGRITNISHSKAEQKRLKKSGHKVKDYRKVSEQKQQQYNNLEKKILNAAYNTLMKVKDYEGISTIRGQVCDESEQPLSGIRVNLHSDTYDLDVYEEQTNDAGYYEIFVPSQKGTYELAYTQKDTGKQEHMYHVDLDQDDLGVDQEIVHMVSDSEQKEYTVRLCDATKDSYDSASTIEGAQLIFRSGYSNKEGQQVQSVVTDDNGYAFAMLAPGMYTVECRRSGYMTEYRNLFFSMDSSIENLILLTPSLSRGEMRIVLTWSATPSDEDSHLFTPDGDHICYYDRELENVNLDVDDTDGYGPETVTIDNVKNGVYKYYVADYTHCSHDEVTSKEMSESDATIRIYTYRGLEKTFHVPKNQEGVIWEVFSIRNGRIVPAQRYYDSIEDKKWCTRK